MPVRLVTENAWHAAFMHNMFVRASEDELERHAPEYTILHAPSLKANPIKDGINSGVFVILALDRGLVIIGGTHYAEIPQVISDGLFVRLLLGQRSQLTPSARQC